MLCHTPRHLSTLIMTALGLVSTAAIAQDQSCCSSGDSTTPASQSCCQEDQSVKKNQDCCNTKSTETSSIEADCFAPCDTSRDTDKLSATALEKIELIALDNSLDRFIDRFNADKDKTRVVAMLSPTCGGCVEGARAVQKSIIETYPDADLSVHIIWEPMLASDNETQAKRSSIIFPDQDVHQYYDPERRSGFAYLKDLFPDYRNEIRASAPANHADRGYLKPGQSGPLWDIYFVYEKGVTWGDVAPKPNAWVKQVLYYPDRTGLMWADDFSAKPLESNLMDEVGALMERVK